MPVNPHPCFSPISPAHGLHYMVLLPFRALLLPTLRMLDSATFSLPSGY